MAEGCLFCKIVAGEIPSERLYADAEVVAFKDIRPVAPHHVLLVPRRHLESVNEVTEAEEKLMGHLLAVAGKLARELGVAEKGYRLVINNQRDAGQEIFHLHLHLLAGRKMGAMG